MAPRREPAASWPALANDQMNAVRSPQRYKVKFSPLRCGRFGPPEGSRFLRSAIERFQGQSARPAIQRRRKPAGRRVLAHRNVVMDVLRSVAQPIIGLTMTVRKGAFAHLKPEPSASAHVAWSRENPMQVGAGRPRPG